MQHLKVRPLSAERVAQAFPLVQTALPKVTLAAWRAFAATLMADSDGRKGGVLAVIDGRDCIVGLSSYRVVPDLVHGRLLDAGLFLAFGLFDRRPVAEALAEGIESVARERGCGAVHTQLPRRDDALPGPGSGLAELLAARGHRIESLGLCKRLVA